MEQSIARAFIQFLEEESVTRWASSIITSFNTTCSITFTFSIITSASLTPPPQVSTLHAGGGDGEASLLALYSSTAPRYSPSPLLAASRTLAQA